MPVCGVCDVCAVWYVCVPVCGVLYMVCVCSVCGVPVYSVCMRGVCMCRQICINTYILFSYIILYIYTSVRTEQLSSEAAELEAVLSWPPARAESNEFVWSVAQLPFSILIGNGAAHGG